MEQLQALKPEQRQAIDKFKEYGALIVLGFGNKATYTDLVHTNSYSDKAISDKIADYREKKNKYDVAEDEGDTVDRTEFSVLDRNNNTIRFSTDDCLNYLRGVSLVRKHYENSKKLDDLNRKIESAKKKALSKDQRISLELQDLENQKRQLLGITEPEEVAKPNSVPEVAQVTAE